MTRLHRCDVKTLPAHHPTFALGAAWLAAKAQRGQRITPARFTRCADVTPAQQPLLRLLSARPALVERNER